MSKIPHVKKILKLGLKLFILLVIILLSFQAYLVYLDLVFESVSLNVYPVYATNSVESGKNFEMNFNYNIQTREHCSTQCTYEFKRLSDDKILRTKEFRVDSEISENLTFEDIITKKGYGQELYQLNIDCDPKALKIKGCNNNDQKMDSSAIININYYPSFQDSEALKKLEEQYKELENIGINAKNNTNYLIAGQIQSRFLNTDWIQQFVNEIKPEEKLSDENLKEFRDLWTYQNPDLFQDYKLQEKLSQANSYLKSTQKTKERFTDLIKIHNETISIAIQIQDKHPKLNEIIKSQNFFNDSIKERIKKFMATYSLDVSELNSRDITDYEFLKADFLNLLNTTTNLQSQYEEKISQDQSIILDIFIINNINCDNDSCISSEDKIFHQEQLNNNSEWYTKICNYEKNKNETIISENTTSQIFLVEYFKNNILDNLTNTTNNSTLSIKSYLDDLEIKYNDISANNTQILLESQTKTIEFLHNCNEDKIIKFPELKAHYEQIIFEESIEKTDLPNEYYEDCCINNACSKCFEKTNIPLILIHGHSFNQANSPFFNTDVYDEYADILVNNYSYIYMGIQGTPENKNFTPIGHDKKMLFLYSYYLIPGEKEYLISNKEHIATYSERLDKFIEYVKEITGSDKVNIVAHSMGGLVTREYILKHGDSSINELILVGTPNKGTTDSINKFCKLYGAQKECDDMYEKSKFITKLNANISETIPQKISIIAGLGCEMDGQDGDGITTKNNILLPDVKTFYIQGTCGALPDMHSDMLNPKLYPTVFETIISEINT